MDVNTIPASGCRMSVPYIFKKFFNCTQAIPVPGKPLFTVLNRDDWATPNKGFFCTLECKRLIPFNVQVNKITHWKIQVVNEKNRNFTRTTNMSPSYVVRVFIHLDECVRISKTGLQLNHMRICHISNKAFEQLWKRFKCVHSLKLFCIFLHVKSTVPTSLYDNFFVLYVRHDDIGYITPSMKSLPTLGIFFWPPPYTIIVSSLY